MDSTRSQVSLNEYGSEVNHSMSTAFVWNRATYDLCFHDGRIEPHKGYAVFHIKD